MHILQQISCRLVNKEEESKAAKTSAVGSLHGYENSNIGVRSCWLYSLRCFMVGPPDRVANLRYFYAGRHHVSLASD